MNPMACVFVFIFGTVFASFYGVVFCRVPKGDSIAFPPSHCYSCGHELRWYENIPVLSYLLSKGKCRECGCKIGFFSFIYELLGGILPCIVYIKVPKMPRFVFAVLICEIIFFFFGWEWENGKAPKLLSSLISLALYTILIVLI